MQVNMPVPMDPMDPLKMEGTTAALKQLDFSHPSP